MAAPSSDVGQTFGKYFLMKKLAAGGMGEIFLAKQQGPAGFTKLLVVKKILAHLTENKEFIEAFLGEARLAAQMNHRNVVQVFELGEEAGNYFIAMEYVAGKSLRDVIDQAIKRKEKLNAELCRLVAEQICDGASYAHNLTDMGGRSLNLVHRDLNPQNVLISYTGDVKVIDFGIAKSEMSTVKTEAGMIKGKFVYMSPEQSLAKKLDKRSDIFAIGITLYEMLTGINPFHKNNIVLTLEAVQRFDPPPPSEYDPSYAPFDPIVAKALTKDRDRRYSDASEMQDDLRRVVLPRPPERLNQLMTRIFRAQLEEEQKMIQDSDSLKLTGSAAKRTPAKPSPAAKPAVVTTMPEGQPPEGATMMLPPNPNKKGASNTPARPVAAAPPPRPAPRPPPPAARKPQGAGDTLIDMGGAVAPAPAGDDEVAGATAMLKPGMLPPPPPRKQAPKPTDTMPEGAMEAGDDQPPDGATAFLGTAPARGPAKKAPAPVKVGSTNIMSVEESDAAREEALSKAKQPPAGVVRGRTRQDAAAAATKKKSSKGTWIALGVGGLVAIGGIVALLFFLLADDSSATPRRKARPSPVEANAVAPAAPKEDAPPAEEKKAAAPAPKKEEAAPAQEEAAPAPRKKPAAPPPEEKKAEAAPKAEPKKVASAGKVFGTLTLNPGPNVPVVFGGKEMPKQVGAFNLPVTDENGSIEVGDGTSTMFKISLDYAIKDGAMNFKVNSVPWAIASVNGPSRGRTPVNDLKVEKSPMTVLELKRPGQENGMTLRLVYKPN